MMPRDQRPRELGLFNIGELLQLCLDEEEDLSTDAKWGNESPPVQKKRPSTLLHGADLKLSCGFLCKMKGYPQRGKCSTCGFPPPFLFHPFLKLFFLFWGGRGSNRRAMIQSSALQPWSQDLHGGCSNLRGMKKTPGLQHHQVKGEAPGGPL